MFTFYILYSDMLDKFYIGHTGDILDNRLAKHNTNHKGFTGAKGDWVVAYKEEYESKTLAYARERTVKSWKSRIRIQQLINKV
jgi:putative endonuclease